jgi:hypothetical protein
MMEFRNWLRQSTKTKEKESDEHQHQTTAKPNSDDAKLQLSPCAELTPPSTNATRTIAPLPPPPLHMLSTVCTDDYLTPYIPVPPENTTLPPESRLLDWPSMRLRQVSETWANITVQIPHHFKRMYSLGFYNNSVYTDTQNLKIQNEDVELKNLKPHTEYTYCVASISNALRVSYICMLFS